MSQDISPASKESFQSPMRFNNHGDKISEDLFEGHNTNRDENKGSLGCFFRVFRYADRISWFLNVIAIVTAIAAGTLLPLMDLVFGKFVTTLTAFASETIPPAEFRSQINKFTLYFIYLFAAKFGLFYIHSVCISIAATRTIKAFRIDLVKHILRQNIAYFDSDPAISVTTQVTTESNNVNNGISEKLTLTIQGMSTFVTAFIVAFVVEWKLTLITMGIVPAILLVVGICMGIEGRNEAKIHLIHSKAALLTEEVFSSISTTHAYWLSSFFSQKYDALLGDAMEVGMRKSPNYSILFSFEFFCIYAGYGLAFWQGIRMYANGEISQSGKVFTVIFAVIVAAATMTTLAPQIVAITKAATSAEALFKTLDRRSTIDPLDESGIRPFSSKGEIKFQDVSFAYPMRPEITVLKRFNVVAPAGRVTALVGASGSGKSTVVGLLERWYDPISGLITFDGVDIRDLNLNWLRTNVRLVQQEPVLFSGTVYENVVMGLSGTPKSKLPETEQRKLVKKACQDAYAEDFIQRLPEGYDTHLGESAIMLSGGEKQRLAIARSIVSDPAVLLLDEATSALDPRAEQIVQQALDRVLTGRTTIIIAHRLSTIRNADNIVVIADGTIVEQGTHDELLCRRGVYARFTKAQDLSQAENKKAEVRNTQKSEAHALVRTQAQVSAYTTTEPLKADDNDYSLMKCIYLIFREQGHVWKWLVLLGVATLAGGATYPAQAVVFSRVVECFQLPPEEAIRRGNLFSLMFFIIALGNLAVFAVVGWGSNVVAQSVSRKYRREIFDRILQQDIAFFDKKSNTTGELASNLSTYPTSLLELLGFNIMLACISLVNVLSSCVLALAIGWKLALVVVVGALLPMLFFGYLRIRLEFKLEEDTSKRFSKSAALASEAVSAIRTVSSLAIEQHIIDTYRSRLQGIAKKSMETLFWRMFWYSLTQSISFLAMALGFWYGGRLISYHQYTTRQFFTVFIAVVFSGEAAAGFFSYTTSFTKSVLAVNYIFWLRRQVPTIREDPLQPPFDDANEGSPPSVKIDQVSFSYDSRPRTKVLESIDITIQSGSFIAFVGASGCGKSTMIALLERFYDPNSGVIFCNRRTLPELCPRKYRRSISLVQQEPVLYQGSVRENIAIAVASEVTDAQIEEAARQSNIYDFIMSLPEGFDTICGRKGTHMSGGQRQRIAIARALIRNPRLLFLDEATSALDTESERVVQGALDQAKRGRTTVAVAHRLSTIKDADTIYVFSQGRVVEKGSHRELLSKKGLYYEMCLAQTLDA
ncbi:hypothetical protein COCSADRAFT_346383 [Bipolaris sorokiniana ND90Pr]|uniref:Uncharacterized protein n=1 Tax=Cochliobolus sativus (strain ND90Pr / ATCC 201652) TaxID=665912 RepID=M2ST72_COCSN|nr:uncharacterized protein COCSADRAFT_346383 [Bipolaris sorokiniana ND90Pr]EMD59972.1 hypothetical protein COCSADRAFT_346383 [Bipolaris sorokiniana ND90Pr]